MNKLNIALMALAILVAGCSRQAESAQQTSVADRVAALEKQAKVQEAVGDKAGAEKMREQAAALRAGGAEANQPNS